MSTKNELLIRIDERYPKFSKGQKRLADYIKENYDKAAFLTAAKRQSVSANQRLSVSQHSLDIKAIPNSRKHWENWCVPS